ncbi:MAG: HEAT repeat domain-containing protein [Verrucomicrobia bacterium]|nr:HEAT repeat domain-containing protein [Verrucomicrobiota bacterium]
MQPDAPDVAIGLIAVLSDKEKEVRASAAEALGYLTSPNRKTVLALGRAVHDGSHRVRLAALQTLDKLGPKAQAAARSIHRALQDPFPSVREAAFEALRKVDRGWWPPRGDW